MNQSIHITDTTKHLLKDVPIGTIYRRQYIHPWGHSLLLLQCPFVSIVQGELINLAVFQVDRRECRIGANMVQLQTEHECYT